LYAFFGKITRSSPILPTTTAPELRPMQVENPMPCSPFTSVA